MVLDMHQLDANPRWDANTILGTVARLGKLQMSRALTLCLCSHWLSSHPDYGHFWTGFVIEQARYGKLYVTVQA